MTKLLKRSSTAALAGSLALGLTAAPAAARDRSAQEEAISETVSAAGLDLTRASDRTRLDHRVRAATRRVCQTGTGTLWGDTDQQCRAKAQQSAERQIASLVERDRQLAAKGVPDDQTIAIAVASKGE